MRHGRGASPGRCSGPSARRSHRSPGGQLSRALTCPPVAVWPPAPRRSSPSRPASTRPSFLAAIVQGSGLRLGLPRSPSRAPFQQEPDAEPCGDDERRSEDAVARPRNNDGEDRRRYPPPADAPALPFIHRIRPVSPARSSRRPLLGDPVPAPLPVLAILRHSAPGRFENPCVKPSVGRLRLHPGPD